MVPALFVFVACTVVRFGAPAVATGGSPVRIGAEAPGASISGLITRIDALLEVVADIDARDRLIELRDLAAGAGSLDLPARRRVTQYVEHALTIEERGRPVSVEESPIQLSESVVITAEEPVGVAAPSSVVAPPPVVVPATPELSPVGTPISPTPTTPTLTAPTPTTPTPTTPAATAPTTLTAPTPTPVESPTVLTDPLAPLHEALVRRDYLGVVALADANPAFAADSGASALRREAVDGWASAEREAAGAAFLAAKELKGAERGTAMRAVLAKLSAINTRFPDNQYAADVARHIELVTAEAAK